jgi:hypothetical protein
VISTGEVFRFGETDPWRLEANWDTYLLLVGRSKEEKGGNYSCISKPRNVFAPPRYGNYMEVTWKLKSDGQVYLIWIR